MQSLQDHRIDLAELKMHIVKTIGAERSRKYFYYLGRFLSQKLSKSEFDKSCIRLLGREDLALHNKLIRSILRIASLARSPPTVHKTSHYEKSLVLGKEDEHGQSGFLSPNCNRNDPVWSNGVLTEVRSETCERTISERPSQRGSNGKVESLWHQRSGNRNAENGDLGAFAYQRSGRYADERGGSFLCPANKMRIPDNGQVVAPLSRDDEAQEERSRLILSTSPVIPPLGIPFCSASVGGARRTASALTRTDFISCYDNGGLLDTEMMRKRIENIAVSQGLGGVSAECSSMLNNMLDVYLKKLIKSCVDLAEARSMPEKQSLDKLWNRREIVNGVQPRNSLRIQTSNQPSDITQEQHSVSLLDFRVAMELTPHQLGVDWPLLRERISVHTFEEREGE